MNDWNSGVEGLAPAHEWKPGQLVEFDGVLAVVVGTELDPLVPEGHLALWFGEPQGTRKSDGGTGGLRAVVSTVPSEYCSLTSEPLVRH